MTTKTRTPLSLPTWAAAGLLCALLVPGAPLGAAETVGRLGHPDRLRFEGVNAFDPEDVRDALRRQMGFHVAGYPDAPRADFLETVQSLVEAGYQRAGFGDVEVRIEVATAAAGEDADVSVVVRVSEGVRYRFGSVRLVDGGDAVPPDEFAAAVRRIAFSEEHVQRRIFSPHAPLFSTFADITMGSAESREALVREAFEELGYYGARYSLRLVKDRDREVADLEVRVTEPGSPATVGEISVSGVNPDQRDAVLALVGIGAGDRVNRGVLRAAERRILESERFSQATVSPSPPGRDGRVILRVRLKQHPYLPPLGEEIAPSNLAMIRMARWLNGWPSQERDWVIEAEASVGEESWYGMDRLRLSAVLTPFGGVLVSISGRGEDGRERGPFSFVLSREVAALYAPWRSEKLVGPPPAEKGMVVSLSIGLDDDGDLGADFGVGSSNIYQEPLRIVPKVEPEGLLAALNNDRLGLSVSVEDGRARFSGQGVRLEVDLATGRPEDIVLQREDGRGELRFRSRFAIGAFARKVALLGESATGFRQSFDQNAPAASRAGFLLRLLADVAAAARDAVGDPATAGEEGWFEALAVAAPRLVSEGVLESFKGFLQDGDDPWRRGAGDRFILPNFLQTKVDQSSLQTAVGYYFTDVYPELDRLVAPGSWAGQVLREAGFLATARAGEAGGKIFRLPLTGEAGPVACLALAAAGRKLSSPMARMAARAGLDRLEADAFLDDLRPFFVGEEIFPRAGRRLLVSLRGLDGEELAKVRRALGRFAPFYEEVISALREGAGGGKEPFDLVAPVIRRHWDPFLREELALLLWALATGLDPRNPGLRLAYGVALVEGFGAKPDGARGLHHLEVEAREGATWAMTVIGRAHQAGRVVERDLEEAFAWFHLAASNGYDPAARYRDELALKLTEAAADRARERAEEIGASVGWPDEDLTPSIMGKPAQLAILVQASMGTAPAQEHLAHAYRLGRGVKKDFTKAVSWYREAAAAGRPEAQHRLGDAYEAGRGVERDREAAVHWWKKAAGQGNADAHFHLGVTALRRGDPEGDREARAHFEAGAEAGSAAAMVKLGEFHLDGRAGLADAAEAYRWVRLAAASGDRRAAPLVERLEKEITGEQRAAAERFLNRKAGLVADLGDPGKIRVEGTRYFSAAEVRAGLASHSEFFVAGYPSARLEGLLRMVEARVLRGYRHAGFPDTSVAARVVDDDEGGEAIVVTVEEGARFEGGRVRLVDGGEVAAGEFAEALERAFRRERITNEGRPQRKFFDSAGIGIAGTTPDFDPAADDVRERLVRAAFEELGRYGARFEVTLEPDAASGQADLVVKVLDPGSERRVAGFSVHGWKKNSREAVLEAAGIPVGERLDTELLSRAELRLMATERFIAVDVEPGDGSREGGAVVKVIVIERPHLPPLGEPLPALDEALIRLGRWVDRWDESAEDLVFTFPLEETGVIQVALDPAGAGTLSLDDGKGRTLFGLLFSKEEIAVLSPLSGEVLTLPDLLRGAKLFSDTDHRPGKPKPNDSSFGFGFVDPWENPAMKDRFEIGVDFMPSALLDGVHRLGDWSASLGGDRDGDSAKVDLGPVRLWFDPVTGRLSRGTMGGEEVLKVDPRRLELERTRLEEVRSKLREVTEGEVIPSAVLGFCGRFFAASGRVVGGSDEGAARGLSSAISKIMAREPLAAFDPANADAERLDEETVGARRAGRLFNVSAPSEVGPGEDRRKSRRVGSSPTRGERYTVEVGPKGEGRFEEFLLGGWFSRFYPVRERWFPAGSWPAKLMEQAGYLYTAHNGEAAKEIVGLFQSRRAGPLAARVVLALPGTMPPAVRQAAAKASLRADEAAVGFRRDLRPFFVGEGAVPEAGRRLLAALGDLKEAEISALVAGAGRFMGSRGAGADGRAALARSFLADASKRIRAAGDGDPFEAIAPALDALFEGRPATESNEVELWAAERGFLLESPGVWFAYGALLCEGLKLQRDPEQGFALLRRAARAGHGGAQAALARAHRLGIGTERDPVEGLAWSIVAHSRAENKAEDQPPPQEFEQALSPAEIDTARRRAEVIASEEVLRPEQVDGKTAEVPDLGDDELMVLGAVTGDPEAQTKLGAAYMMGREGFNEDDERGLGWIREAAETGRHPEAQHRLGDCYAWGSGVEVNRAEARRWWARAAAQGNGGAHFHLGGDALRSGRPGAEAEAFEHFMQAAEGSVLGAMVRLAELYHQGKGTAADPVEAYKWAWLAARAAARAGDESEAEKLRQRFGTQELLERHGHPLSAEQRDEAHRRADLVIQRWAKERTALSYEGDFEPEEEEQK